MLAVVFAGGCALPRDPLPPTRATDSGIREVRPGDTLYSIAWESGQDFKELAEWNGIEPPYLIKPGQQIRLSPPRDYRPRTRPPTSAAKQPAARPAIEDRAATHLVARGETLYAIAKKRNVRYQDLAAWNAIKPPYVITPGQQLRVTPPTTARPPVPATPSQVSPTKTDDDSDADGAAPIVWSWPTEGTIIARFSASGTNKGIDIAGTAGQPIRVAAPGRVVYQGSGLRGYGQLIIVKHNSDFLSAYAHCGTIYVKETSVIKPGQTICTMGDSGTDRVKLHFEIRRRGVPVDPMDYLPKK
jgi:lipoprotein NlpD